MTALLHRKTASVPPVQAVRRVALDNELVLVTETTYSGRTSVPMHVHRYPHVLYAIDGGTAETTSPDGLVQTLELKAGDALWRLPQSHSARSLGSRPLRIVEVEVKDTFTRYTGDGVAQAFAPAELEWTADKLDPTRTIARMVGDPTKPGPYTVRVRAEPGYAIAMHLHPEEDEYLTVISGTLHWSCGEAGSGAAEHQLAVGGFVMFPAGVAHRLWVDEETVLQMSGIGPRKYVYLKA